MSITRLHNFWKRVRETVYVSYERTRPLPGQQPVLLLGEGNAEHKAEVWQNQRVQAAKAGAKVHCINLGLAKLIVVEEPTLLLEN